MAIHRFCSIAIVGSLVLFQSSVLAESSTQALIGIDGVVLSVSEKPIPQVHVTVYREGRQIADTKTDKDGAYELKIATGTPIEVSYFNTDWGPGVVGPISGARSSRINQVLLKAEDRLSSEAALSQLHNYERIYYLEAPTSSLQAKRTDALREQLRKMQVPVESSVRASEIWALYGRGVGAHIDP